MRKNTINSNDIILAAIHLVASNGLENLSTKKVSLECHISEGSIFNYFRTKKDLLTQCLYYIDSEIDSTLKTVPYQGLPLNQVMSTLWFTYFDFLTTHGDYAKYYRQFRHSSYYTTDVIEGQNRSYSYFSQFILANAHKVNGNIDVLWTYVIETTLNFAIRVADGQFTCSESDRVFYFQLITQGICSAIDPESLTALS